MSKSASLPAQPFDAFDPPSNESAVTPAWKQEVNQRLAAHRNRRGGPLDSADGHAAESPRATSARAAEAAARVAARYAKAPSYSELLAGEARAVVRAAGAAAEAARNAQAAAQAVLAGLESAPIASGLWEPNPQSETRQGETRQFEARRESNGSGAAVSPASHVAPRWQDEPPVSAPERVQVNSHGNAQVNSLAPWAGAQPRWEETLPMASPEPQHGQDVWSEMRLHSGQDTGYRQGSERHLRQGQARTAEELDLFPDESLDYEDSYDSQDPVRSATIEPVQHLPANLIEFPRELVATRKVRPRLAEGPFYNASHENSQLSIFEVDPDLLASPAYPAGSAHAVAPPEWASIELDHLEQHVGRQYSPDGEDQQVYVEHRYSAEMHAGNVEARQLSATAVEELPVLPASVPVVDSVRNAPPKRSSQARDSVSVPESAPAELLVATLSDRLLAAVVDAALVTLALAAAAVVVIASTSHPPTGRIALIASGCGLLLFGLLYQFLFLSYAEEGTLGMRYARIALCTFDDDNPTVDQMRQRIPALLLSALPAGLGLLWAIFDKDRLGWHDRMTRTYQRKY